MEECWVLKSVKLLDEQELTDLSRSLKERYKIGVVQWYEDESLKKSGWHYSFIPKKNLSIQDLKTIKEKGLTLLLTQDQIAKLMKKRPLRSFDIIANYPIEIIDVPHGTGTGTGS